MSNDFPAASYDAWKTRSPDDERLEDDGYESAETALVKECEELAAERDLALADWRRALGEAVKAHVLVVQMREALIQARGALRLDAMHNGKGEFYGTTTVALEAIDEAIDASDLLNWKAQP